MTTTPVERPTYGNWRRPTTTGSGRFNVLTTLVILGGALVFVVAMAIGGVLIAAAIAVPVVAIIATLTMTDRHQRTLASRITERATFARSRQRRENIYRAGPVGLIPHGRNQLPGIAAQIRQYEATDSYGRPFVLLHTPSTNHWSVPIECDFDGASLIDDIDQDRRVAEYGGWLAGLSEEQGIAGASVTVETAADSGHRLRQEVDVNTDPNAPALARESLAESKQTLGGAPLMRGWITVTFKASTTAGHRRDKEEMARDLGARLPHLVTGLAGSGVGAAEPMTVARLNEIVKTAYDPVLGPVFDEAAALGQQPELEWSDVGPAAMDAGWNYLRHDSGLSGSWVMSVPPQGNVGSSVLEALLRPHPDLERKRVTIVYRPIPAGDAATVVERDVLNADLRVQTNRPSARDRVAQRAAHKTAADEAEGAGLEDFGVIITATVLDDARWRDAEAITENLAARARLRIRPAFGAQGSAFAAGLPLGLVLPAHMRVPETVRKAL